MRREPLASSPEPEGFGDAVEAAALMLALTTALAWVGFQWQRGHERAAHRFAVELIERVARNGDRALVPVWSGLGRGPASEKARETFRILSSLGNLTPVRAGQCRVTSRFALCRGTRYNCEVTGRTAAGPFSASIGICSTGAHVPYSFDTFDLTVPAVDGDRGNRDGAELGRDGFIRYGTSAPPPPGPLRRDRRALSIPL